MSGSLLQTMGTASKLIRLMILILVGIIVWRLWYYVFPMPSSSISPAIQLKTNDIIQPRVLPALPHERERLVNEISPPPMRVVVYYEALCPDSRDFVSRQLVPAYEAMSDVVDVDLVPYGKATSKMLSTGRRSFTCQHGPKECRANTVHACVAKHVADPGARLRVVHCMIKANSRRSDPVLVGRKCMTESLKDSDWGAIEKCALGSEGEELLFHMGKMTEDLNPRATFIPTITINDSPKNQPLILKNFIKALCVSYSGPKHVACGPVSL